MCRFWIRSTGLVALTLLAQSAVVSMTQADEPCCCIVDGHTRYMWARTWYGPNALATPLRDYYIPRMPVPCDHISGAEGFSAQNGVPDGPPNQYGARPYPASAAVAFEPQQ